MSRRPHSDEVRQFFDGVDSDILYEMRWADLVEIDDNGRMQITDNAMMFRFMLRRLFPAESHPDD